MHVGSTSIHPAELVTWMHESAISSSAVAWVEMAPTAELAGASPQAKFHQNFIRQIVIAIIPVTCVSHIPRVQYRVQYILSTCNNYI